MYRSGCNKRLPKAHLLDLENFTLVSEFKNVSLTRCITLIILLLKIRPALIYQNPSLSWTLAVMAERNQPTDDAELSSIWRWDDSEPLRWAVAKLSGPAGLPSLDGCLRSFLTNTFLPKMLIYQESAGPGVEFSTTLVLLVAKLLQSSSARGLR